MVGIPFAKGNSLGIMNKGRKRPDLTERNLKNNPMKNQESIDKMKNSDYHKNLKGDNNPNYQNFKEDAGYTAIHNWISLNFGRANKCEFNPEHKGKFQWSNKEHRYSRNREDWQQLCVNCHREYDKEYNGK